MAINTTKPVKCFTCGFGVIVFKKERACSFCGTYHKRINGKIQWRKTK